MSPNLLELRTLSLEDRKSFLSAIAAFKHADPAYLFAFEFDEAQPFEAYIQKLDNWALGLDLPGKFVPNSFLVGVVAGQIVGRVSIRHQLNEFLEKVGGHIGFGVIPSHRKMGYAAGMLRQALPICRSLGLSRVLITCKVDNIGSARVIEGCGGIFESVTEEPGQEVQFRRYWLNLT